MMEEVRNPIKSASWKPHSTFAADAGLTREGKLPVDTAEKKHLHAGTHHLGGEHVLHEGDVAPAAPLNPEAANQV
jgi:SP family sugar:H+ symporter-like MFS transporter